MGNDFDHRVREIFAVLPEGQAAIAARETVDSWLGETTPDVGLPWLDLDARGAVLRGGVTSLATLSTRLVTDPTGDPELARLAAAGPAARAGEVVAAPDCGRFFWFAPSPQSGHGRGAVLRGLAIGPAAFAGLIARFDADRGVTPAESRALFQLVAGQGPRGAAALDGVSFETKRAQLKSLCAKLDCGGQTDLVRRAIGQLVQLLYLTESGGGNSRVAEQFARDHLPSEVRLSIDLAGADRAVRSFECGPVAGRPVLLAHGMLFPLVLLNAGAACARLGLRILMPLRSGYLDEQSTAAFFSEVDRGQDQDDIAQYIARFGDPIPVVGHSIGASWAIDFARRHPARVDRLILLSPNFLGDRRSSSVFSSFLDGLKALAARPGLLRYIAWQFRKQFLDERVLRDAWRRLCGNSADDMAVLDGRSGAGSIYGWFADGYRSSASGVADDMVAGVGSWRVQLADLPCPVTIIVGPNDPVAGFMSEWEALAGTPNITLVRLPAGGHLVCASHAGHAWQAVADAL